MATVRMIKKITSKLTAITLLLPIGASWPAFSEEAASASSSCLVEKGYRLYKTMESTRAIKNVGKSNLKVQCLGAPKENRQMITFMGQKYFIDASGVISQQGYTFISEQKYRVEQGYVLWADALSNDKKGAFYNSGLDREYIKLFQTADGKSIVENDRAQVILTQRNRRGELVSLKGWVSVSGIQEFSNSPETSNPSLKSEIEANLEATRLSKDFPEIYASFSKSHKLLKKHYKQKPISQIGSNPKIYITKESSRIYDQPSTINSKVVAELSAFERLSGFADIKCQPNHGCMNQIQMDSSSTLDDGSKSQKIRGWVQNDKTAALSAKTEVLKDTLAMSTGDDVDGVIQVDKGSKIIDLNLEVCFKETESCFHRVMIQELESSKNIVAWISASDYIDPVQVYISARSNRKGEAQEKSEEIETTNFVPSTQRRSQKVKSTPKTENAPQKTVLGVTPAVPLTVDQVAQLATDSDAKPEAHNRSHPVMASSLNSKEEKASEIEDQEAQAGDEGDLPDNEQVVLVDGAYEPIVCLSHDGNTLNVRDESFQKVLFSIGNGDKIKVFQDFGSVSKKLGKKTYEIIKIQDTHSKVGWVSKEFIKQASECDSLESERPAANNTEQSDDSSNESKGESDAKDDKDLQRSKLKIGQTATVCTSEGGDLSVYDLNFTKLEQRFFLRSGEKIEVTDNLLRDKPKANGYKYIQVKTESGYDRYVAKDFLTTKKCESTFSAEGGGTASNGYIFPTTSSTGYSYLPNGRRPHILSALSSFPSYRGNWGLYGARRSGGGRAHAATDLYQPRGLARPNSNYSKNYFGGAFRAMNDGKVIRNATYFYEGTSYIVVHHNDNVVARYGEIYPGTTYRSSRVKMGQTLGYIKWVGVGAVPPMLHFESYKPGNSDVRRGLLGGNKRINGRNSQRSTHLFDRTNFMKNLERNTFGR